LRKETPQQNTSKLDPTLSEQPPHYVYKESLELLRGLSLAQLVSLAIPFPLVNRAAHLDLSLPLLQTGLYAITTLLFLTCILHVHGEDASY